MQPVRIIEHCTTFTKNGADINLCKENEANALFTACENVRFSTVELLHRIGADIYFCKENRTSPLGIAYKNGHDNTGQLLLKNISIFIFERRCWSLICCF